MTPSIWKEHIKNMDFWEMYELWQDLPEDVVLQYFLLLEQDHQTQLLTELTTTEQEHLIIQLAEHDIHEILEHMPPDNLVNLFRNLNDDIKTSVWKKLSKDTQTTLQFLLNFDEDAAAGIMTPNYVAIQPDTTVEKTLKFIRQNSDEVETIYYIYVVDAIGRLQGVLSLRDLITKKDSTLIKDFMTTMIFSVQADTDQEDVAEMFNTHNLLAIPVVDKFNRLQGIVTVDDVIDVIQEEHHEDVLQMNAISVGAGDKSYMESSIFHQFKTRIPWLILLLLAGTLTSNVISLFDNVIAIAGYMVWFIPVVTSAGGNTATQSSTLMIRGFARGEIEFRNTLAILGKEIVVALLIGLCLGAVMIIRGIVFPPQISLLQSLALSFSLVFVVLFSAIIGCFVPLLIHKMKIDPTVVATQLIATVIDLLGLTIYFSLTQLALRFF